MTKGTIPKMLTTVDVCRMFKRTQQTIMNWRRYEAMPYIRIPGDDRDMIRFDRAAVLEWARKKGKEVAA